MSLLSDCYLDNRASHHITANLADLFISNAYDGSDKVTTGNGQGLNIQTIDSTSITSPHKILTLNNVLNVTLIHKKLLLVQQFARDDRRFFEFHYDFFFL